MTSLTLEALQQYGKNGDATFPVKFGELEGTARRLTTSQIGDYEMWFIDSAGHARNESAIGEKNW